MLIFGFQLKLDDAGKGMPGRSGLQGIVWDPQNSVIEASRGVIRWYWFLVTNKALHFKPNTVLVTGFSYLNEHLSGRVKNSLS